uniref:HECT domain-containing protein n=1 Tax=Clytia hemisphaerica TaxID=252671 RepID=A0A7M5UM64_9CNID|eukprot:TCONS_00036993-protein
MGGPRKEFFQYLMQAINKEYFEKGLQEYKKEDYVIAGFAIGLSILQNGKLPYFFTEERLTSVFGPRSEKPCIQELQLGLSEVGIYQIGRSLPTFLHLFRGGLQPLTVKRLTQIMRPVFKEEGTNARIFENKLFEQFRKYIKEVAAGRRGPKLQLGTILQFFTGMDEEPMLGYEIHPTIKFDPVPAPGKFTPTTHACINQLVLFRATPMIKLLPQEKLFEKFDYAFCNHYYRIA